MYYKEKERNSINEVEDEKKEPNPKNLIVKG